MVVVAAASVVVADILAAAAAADTPAAAAAAAAEEGVSLVLRQHLRLGDSVSWLKAVRSVPSCWGATQLTVGSRVLVETSRMQSRRVRA